MVSQSGKSRGIRRWLKATSNRVYFVYPVLIILIELLLGGGRLTIVPWGLPLLPWGYVQYHLCGKYRTAHGGGGPGLDNPPERIVDSGIYAWTRNPMYLGHVIFLLGLAISLRSLPALVLLIALLPWYGKRVRKDETHLAALFGQPYEEYRSRVKRWIPGLF